MEDVTASAAPNDNTGGGGQSVTTPEASSTPQATETTGSFLDSLPEALRGNELFTGVENVGQMAEKYAELHSNMPKAPESYEFKLPDGFKADEKAMEQFKGIAKELGITQEQAQKLMEFDIQRQQAGVQSFNDRVAGYESQLKEQWKDGYEENVKLAKQAYGKFASDELTSLLNETGLGSHPVIVNLFHSLSKSVSEGSLPSATGKTASKPNMGIDGRPMLNYPSLNK